MTYKNKIMTINIPKAYIEFIELLKNEGLYPSKTEIVRVALRNFFAEEIELIQALKDKKILNKIAKIENFDKFIKSLSIFEYQMKKRIIN